MHLVIGPTGNVGRHVVAGLVEKGQKVRALCPDGTVAEEAKAMGAQPFPGSLDDEPSLARAMDGVARLFLMAPPDRHLPARQRRSLDAAKAAGVRRVVHLSSLKASPHAADSFSQWNGWGELAVDEAGIPATKLRPTMFLQNIAQAFPKQIKKNGHLRSYGGNCRIAFVDARDVAACAVVCLLEDGHEGRTYELTGPEALSYADLAGRIAAKLGRPVSYLPWSEREAWDAMLAMGQSPDTVHGMIGLLHQLMQGAQDFVTGTVERLTGRPAIGLDRYLDENMQVFR